MFPCGSRVAQSRELEAESRTWVLRCYFKPGLQKHTLPWFAHAQRRVNIGQQQPLFGRMFRSCLDGRNDVPLPLPRCFTSHFPFESLQFWKTTMLLTSEKVKTVFKKTDSAVRGPEIRQKAPRQNVVLCIVTLCCALLLLLL